MHACSFLEKRHKRGKKNVKNPQKRAKYLKIWAIVENLKVFSIRAGDCVQLLDTINC